VHFEITIQHKLTTHSPNYYFSSWDVEQDFIMEGSNITEAVNKVKANLYASNGVRGDEVRILEWHPLQEEDDDAL